MNTPRVPEPKSSLLKKIIWGLLGLQALLTIRRYRAVRFSAVSPDPEGTRMNPPDRKQPEVKPLKTFIGAFIGLQVLLAITIGSAFLNFGGAANTAINLSVSVIMMLLLMTLFMHETAARRLTQLASLAGILWIILMIGLMLADYLTRVHIPAPW